MIEIGFKNNFKGIEQNDFGVTGDHLKSLVFKQNSVVTLCTTNLHNGLFPISYFASDSLLCAL